MNPKTWVMNSLLPFFFFGFCISIDTLTPNQSLKDGDLLVSSSEKFALGFFSPGNSRNRYIGIWHYRISEQRVVWVANRDDPISNTSGVLSIGEDGNLIVYYGNQINIPLWQTNISTAAAKTTGYSARLLDSGNLVLFGGKNVKLWQSFDHPTNTLIPGMKLGLDRRTGLNRFLTSWKAGDNPAAGESSYRVDTSGLPHLALYKGRGPVPLWRSVPWIGNRYSGTPKMTPDFLFNISYADNEDEVSMLYDVTNSTIVLKFLDEFGYIQLIRWSEDTDRWVAFFTEPKDQCDNYGWCGANRFCDPNGGLGFECVCLPGYELRSAREWHLPNESGDQCVKKRESIAMCGNGEGFVKVANTIIPDTSSSMAWAWMNMSLEGCKKECLKNCSCTAYTTTSSGDCITWYGNLMDVRTFNGGLDLYVRVDATELEHLNKSGSTHGKKRAIVVTSVVVPVLIVSLVCWLIWKKKESSESPIIDNRDSDEKNLEVPTFEMVTIAEATNKFCNAKKIGEGGFGPVYQGQLSDGKYVAVKRLSADSNQGLNEFKNEVNLIAKLQHRNLVKLLGCCIHEEERMLVYEYMPNGSLDSFIFGIENGRSKLLTWKKSLDIILGIVQGVLYLHRDSRLRVIHRDLKTSNVLLDSEMNPKVSDFGLARAFGDDQSLAKTKRVVGTYGYMSPEYAIDGLFSMKSDVFSFGVMVLEIISGKRNRMFHHTNHNLNLLGHAWKLWNEGRAHELLDPAMEGPTTPISEVLRCIQVGLLCVQKCPDDRPTMSSVQLMLVTENAMLPQPKQPGFYVERDSSKTPLHPPSESISTINEVTITHLEAR